MAGHTGSGNSILLFKKTSDGPLSGPLPSRLQIIAFHDTYLLLGDGSILLAMGMSSSEGVILPVTCDLESRKCHASSAGWEVWSFQWNCDEQTGMLAGELSHQIDVGFEVANYEQDEPLPKA